MVCIRLKHGSDPASRFNEQQLKMGVKVEKEHTGSSKVAGMIARAHLVENPRYYTYLKAMEKKMNKRK